MGETVTGFAGCNSCVGFLCVVVGHSINLSLALGCLDVAVYIVLLDYTFVVLSVLRSCSVGAGFRISQAELN